MSRNETYVNVICFVPTGTGNGGLSDIMLEDLVVKDFEVAGIQLNGPKSITIRRSTVGPSARSQVMATFASARFIGLWFYFVYQHLWSQKEVEVLLKNNYITFAENPDATSVPYAPDYNNYTVDFAYRTESLYNVFKRLFITENLFARELTKNELQQVPAPRPDGTSEDFSPILEEANQIYFDPSREAEKARYLRDGYIAFNNTRGRPDGGTLYGIK